MKRALCLAVVFVLFSVLAASAATTAGSNELIFGFSGLSNLGLNGYQGGIGMRHYLSDNVAIRPGLNFGLNTSKVKATTPNTTDNKTSVMNFGVNAVLEQHLGDMKTVSPYLGVGAGIGFSSNKNEPSRATSPANGTVLKTTVKGTNLDVFGVAGFQWFFVENVSLGGEYQFGLTYAKGKTETQIQGAATQTSGDTTGMNLGFNTSVVYISVGW